MDGVIKSLEILSGERFSKRHLLSNIMKIESEKQSSLIDYKRGYKDGKSDGYEQGYRDAMNKFKPKDFYDLDNENF
jgi:flagellar biosynthesis/type III secretory pathway protein FliH